MPLTLRRSVTPGVISARRAVPGPSLARLCGPCRHPRATGARSDAGRSKMRIAGRIAARAMAAAAAAHRPGRDDRQNRPGRARGVPPGAMAPTPRPSAAPQLPQIALHLGQRGDLSGASRTRAPARAGATSINIGDHRPLSTRRARRHRCHYAVGSEIERGVSRLLSSERTRQAMMRGASKPPRAARSMSHRPGDRESCYAHPSVTMRRLAT